jgi:hypothetical protein
MDGLRQPDEGGDQGRHEHDGRRRDETTHAAGPEREQVATATIGRWSRCNVMRKPEMTKKTSTPT